MVVNSGMRNTVAQGIFARVWPALSSGRPVTPALFGHAGKVSAIERVWRLRDDYLSCFRALGPEQVVDWCESLPWIGRVTKYHLAKNLGADVAKPDRWLERLARAEGATTDELCRRLARASGDRVATVDVVLWRACAVGALRVDDGTVSLARSDA